MGKRLGGSRQYRSNYTIEEWPAAIAETLRDISQRNTSAQVAEIGGDDGEDVILIHCAATCQRERRNMTMQIALGREERVTCQYGERKKKSGM